MTSQELQYERTFEANQEINPLERLKHPLYINSTPPQLKMLT